MISVISVTCIYFFFDEPIFSLTVSRVSNWVELGVFEFTALVITQLSNRANIRALEAVAERRDTELLYQTARRILLWDVIVVIPATWSHLSFTMYLSFVAWCYLTVFRRLFM